MCLGLKSIIGQNWTFLDPVSSRGGLFSQFSRCSSAGASGSDAQEADMCVCSQDKHGHGGTESWIDSWLNSRHRRTRYSQSTHAAPADT